MCSYMRGLLTVLLDITPAGSAAASESHQRQQPTEQYRAQNNTGANHEPALLEIIAQFTVLLLQIRILTFECCQLFMQVRAFVGNLDCIGCALLDAGQVLGQRLVFTGDLLMLLLQAGVVSLQLGESASDLIRF